MKWKMVLDVFDLKLRISLLEEEKQSEEFGFTKELTSSEWRLFYRLTSNALSAEKGPVMPYEITSSGGEINVIISRFLGGAVNSNSARKFYRDVIFEKSNGGYYLGRNIIPEIVL